MKRTYSQIDMDERRKIARWRTAGTSVNVIAEKLHRHRSTIFRELRRNTFEDREMPDLNGYYCVMANDMARERRAKLRKWFWHLRQSVIERIMHGWSPQQIAGRIYLTAPFIAAPVVRPRLICSPAGVELLPSRESKSPREDRMWT